MPPASTKSRLPHGWAALIACIVIPGVTNSIFLTCYSLWVVPWLNEFHTQRGTVMGGFGIGNLVMGLASPLVGYTLERISARTSVALGALALGAGLLLAAAMSSIGAIIVIYATLMAMGAAYTGILPVQSVAVRLFPERAGTIGGLIILGTSGGGVLMPLLFGALVADYGWRLALLAAGGLVLATVVPLAWFLFKDLGGPLAHDAEASTRAPQITTRALIRDLAFWTPLFGIVPVMFVVGAVLTNSVAIATDSGISLRVAPYLVAAMALGGALGSVALGWLADRMNYRLLFVAVAAALVLSLLLLASHVGLWPMALAFAVIGFSGGGVMPVLAAVVARTFGHASFARVMGMMMPGLVVAMALAPALTARVRDLTGSYRLAFVYCAVLMVASGLSVLLIKVKPRASGDVGASGAVAAEHSS